jgi:hypothetical protein
MADLQRQFEEVQTVHSINRMLNTISATFSLFRFLVGDKARFCDFKKFLYLYHKNDANLPKIVADYVQLPYNSNFLIASEAARQLFSAQESIQKFDYTKYNLEFIDGDKELFDHLEKNFHFSAKKTLTKPGQHSDNAYLIAFPSDKLFIKPTTSLERALNESKAYKLSKELGISEYFLPSCVVKINKKEYAVVTKILPSGFISLDELEHAKPGSGDGLIKSMVESGAAHKLALFDYLIDNSDRHKNNIFVSGNKIYLIDHTEAFLKKESGFIPGYLRLSSFKTDKQLPICKNELSLQEWIRGLNISDPSYAAKLKNININSPSKAINELWQKYYGE